MIYHLILSPDAIGQIRSAVRWYVRKDINLPRRFSAELNETLDRIAENPKQYPLVDDLIRRAVMKRFPYSVYFTFSAGTVYVLRILHQRQLNSPSRP